jgi:hypothetical protein
VLSTAFPVSGCWRGFPRSEEKFQRQLALFRNSQPGRTKLPESLWQAAVELARQHGIYAVAHPLRLDYTRLKQRPGGIPKRRQEASKPAFIEFLGGGSATLPECVIEFESATGSN